ncbi:MAG TPA: class II fumarate hydratase [Actinomycetes bacterium]|nr:class II fumarate hydratase [Actinomycetes bacterium]
MTNDETRTERDSMGEVHVAADARWGASTQRAIQNFRLSGRPVAPEIVHALAMIKAAAATSNAALGVIDPALAAAIASAADEVAAGRHDDQFPVDRYQTGSGTSTNMNVNEVVAHRARETSGLDIHPNDHVNASQSSNDTFPTAIHLAVALLLRDQVIPNLQGLEDALLVRSHEWHDVVKPGRTHLMDAAPVTLGQEFNGFAGQVRHSIDRIDSAVPRLLEVPLGGTAVGTGLNAPAGFAEQTRQEIADRTGIALAAPSSPMAAQSARDALVEISASLRGVALALMKICNDLRWMGSGPHAGLAEIRLPAVQPGSSIMPGKVNPVIPEAVVQACCQVAGLDAAIVMGASTSAFQLNTAMPLIGCNVVDQSHLIGASAEALLHLVPGITADPAKLRRSAESSPAVATSLNLLVGYDTATAVVKEAETHGLTIRAAAQRLVDDGLVSAHDLEAALDIDQLAQGGHS